MDVQSLHPTRLQPVPPPTDLLTCSLCLRVLRGAEWTDAEQVITELRTYELAEPPRLRAGICGACAAAVARRRAGGDELRAA